LDPKQIALNDYFTGWTRGVTSAGWGFSQVSEDFLRGYDAGQRAAIKAYEKERARLKLPANSKQSK
jgi:hypothetical protein